MSKLTVTNFSLRTGSPFKNRDSSANIVHEEVLDKSDLDRNKGKCEELMQKVNKKTADYQASKPSSGVFTEVVTHGAFTSKKTDKDASASTPSPPPKGTCGKPLLGFPSSANDLALDAKSDLESDPNLSKEVKEQVIQKLFALVSMVQHGYESKVRIMAEFEKFKDTHLKAEVRREREHAEQLYKLNMSFQSDVVQCLQQMKNELDLSRNIANTSEDLGNLASLKDMTLNCGVDQANNLNVCNDEINL